ncbi:hypothetical protein BJX70DRAFT_367561 [Aspergillus crustosus]
MADIRPLHCQCCRIFFFFSLSRWSVSILSEPIRQFYRLVLLHSFLQTFWCFCLWQITDIPF